ncbi:MAG: Coq4 family protein [Cyanobacteriota bacterium]|nr:Coq4 family protein [Cyanobacteriota bacterium]
MSFQYINKLITPEKVDQFLQLVDLAAGAGKVTSNVFDISDKLNNSRPMDLCVQAIQRDPVSARLVEERYVGEPYNLEALLKLPKESLGGTYARVLNALGYDPQFYRTPATFNSDAEYISYRVYKTHDIHHILTGFSLDNLGELGVISVTAAQIRFPAFCFLDLLTLMGKFFMSDRLHSDDLTVEEEAKTLRYSLELISQGLQMGQDAKLLFPIKWEEGMERPLKEWREELKIEPALAGPYSWYQNSKILAALA